MLEKKNRLDIRLVELGFTKSRNQAKTLIEGEKVLVNEKIINKANFLVSSEDVIKIKEALKYVSRAGLKLEKAIDQFELDFNNKVVLDIGASTGGFTDCSLQHGAKKVYALDVGYNQLDKSLLNNSKIVNIEKTNVKDLSSINFDDKIEIIVCDVSFISLKYVFKNVNWLCDKDTTLVFLIKPQFELSPEIISKCNASVKDKKYHNLAINNVKGYALESGFKILNITESPIKGGKSENTEFLALIKKWN